MAFYLKTEKDVLIKFNPTLSGLRQAFSPYTLVVCGYRN